MLDFVQVEVEASDIVEEWFWLVRKKVALESPKNSILVRVFLRRPFFVDFAQEVVHIHSLVDVQKHSDPLVLGKAQNIDLLEFSRCYEVLLELL